MRIRIHHIEFPGHRRFPLAAAALALLLGFPTIFLQAENSYWAQFGNRPVTIEQVNTGGGSQKLIFTDYRDDMLVAELPGGVGEVSLPVSESMAQNLRFDFPRKQELSDLITSGKYAIALQDLRPVAYPLIRFVQIPEAFYQIHVPVRMLLDALIGAGELDEARDLISRIPMDRTSPEYSERALALAQLLLVQERYTEAAEVALALPFGEGYRTNIAPALAMANLIRGAAAYETVIPLYHKILAVAPESSKPEIEIWLAYSLVLAEKLDEAATLIEGIDEPATGDPLFSLYKLLQGSRYYREENYRGALDVLTRGFVKSEASFAWVPEMLYLIGDCYAISGNVPAAHNTWSEITALYPASAWAARARESLDTLPSTADESAEDSELTE